MTTHDAPWAQPADACLTASEVSEAGLDTAEAARLRDSYGPNKLP